jgi:hypothetical protein
MKYSALYAAAMASLVAHVAADFQIYFETQVMDLPGGGDSATTQGILIFDGQPSCDDVNSAKFVALVADASSPTYARCKGCGDEKDITSWDIEELEINGSGWDHITLYQTGGYLVTPADGRDYLGDCDRVEEDDAHQYNCAIPFLNGKGTRLFRCKSDELSGYRG